MTQTTGFEARTVTALVEDRPGVLARIAGLCRRRGIEYRKLGSGTLRNGRIVAHDLRA